MAWDHQSTGLDGGEILGSNLDRWYLGNAGIKNARKGDGESATSTFNIDLNASVLISPRGRCFCGDNVEFEVY